MKNNTLRSRTVRMLVAVLCAFGCVFLAGQEAGVDADNGIPAPTLVALDGAVFQGNLAPTLNWSEIPGAVCYTLEYAANSDFANPTAITGITAHQYTFANAERLAIDGTVSTVRLDAGQYYWRVKAVGQNAQSSYSATDSFTIESRFPFWTIVLLGLAMVGYMAWQIFV